MSLEAHRRDQRRLFSAGAEESFEVCAKDCHLLLPHHPWPALTHRLDWTLPVFKLIFIDTGWTNSICLAQCQL